MFDFRQMNVELKEYCSGESIFDYYRLVDPKTFEVFKYEKNAKLVLQDEQCFCYWDRNEKCHNCIARHSYVKQKQYVKLEFMYGKVFFIVSKPVNIQERMLTIELVKDITASMLGFNYYRAENKNVENIVSQFNELAVRDILTGVYNIDYINNYLEDFLHKDIKGNTLVAGAIDIDNYTNINVLYGFAVGNEVLQFIAGILEKCAISYGGMVGRLGPDEMALFLTNTTEEEMEQICKELNKKIISEPIIIQNNELKINFTYAVASLNESDEADDFMSRLYFNLRMAQGKK